MSLEVVENVAWKPQEGPQSLACALDYDELFYGGAAGGGKSDVILGKPARGIQQYGRAWRGVVFRRSYKQLEELERRAIEIYAPIYGIESFKRGNDEWIFPNGASLKFRAMVERDDVYKYQGHQYNYIAFDELTQWPDDWWYEYLSSRLRSPEGVPCQMLSASNPGGVGHNWVKSRFLEHDDGTYLEPLNPKYIKMPSGRVKTLLFIPAKLEDNKILIENDPGYIDRLESLGDPELVRALRHGDWDVLGGDALPQLRRQNHVIKNVWPKPGDHVWRAFDWGSFKPYAGLWAFRNVRSQIVVFTEMYGCGPKPNTGLNRAAEDVWEDIQDLEREHKLRVKEAYLDPQCWEKDPGMPSIFDQLGGMGGCWRPWAKGPGSRVNQKAEIDKYLKIVNGEPRLVFCERCVHTWRTLTTLPRDSKNPEDVDSAAEDHLYDALRGIVCKNIPTQAQWKRMLANRRKSHEEVYGTARGAW